VSNNKKTAIIIGAGPAGLTAAFELLNKTDIKPIIFEQTGDIGGISKTINYKGNRIDIGGHRFFSKSDRVMNFWMDILPVQTAPAKDDVLLNRELPPNEFKKTIEADPQKEDKVMLVRERLSRILFLRKFFDYPISLTLVTVANLGIFRMVKITLSYLKARIFRIKEEKSLEDFLINRFGKELYKTFFKDYTEKVWGISCDKINPQWGAQRIKGLSITRAIIHAVKALIYKDKSIGQKEIETSLISQFLYPKYGPGQLWEEVSRKVEAKGGQVILNHKVIGLENKNGKIYSVTVRDEKTNEVKKIEADFVFSTMPVQELIEDMQDVPQNVKTVADGLCYRDFITVGLLASKLKIKNNTNIKTINNIVPDNWIYIQEKDVKIGRLQVFNNWSPYMVADDNTVWLGLEYFCDKGDDVWDMNDDKMKEFAGAELEKVGIVDKSDIIDSVVARVEKTYPAYFGTYDQFDVIKNYTDSFANLFLIGRNGMHRYNNQDHSMLTAMTAVENIIEGVESKENIWQVNAEEDYHETKITAVENLTDVYIAKEERAKGHYLPDVYWEDTGVSYPYYPSVMHRKRFILSQLEKCNISQNEFVFDYGCGEGGILAEIKKSFSLKNSQLAGCDISSKAIAMAKNNIGGSNLFAEVFPKLSQKYDFVICSEVIEHTADYGRILEWIKNNLKVNGKLILTTQSGKVHSSDKYTGHTQHFKIQELNSTLESLGFEIEESYLWGFPFFTLQKYLTNIKFDKIKQNYLEGGLTLKKKVIFSAAYALFFMHDLIKLGPQIYIVAKKK
jgi:protoporphyrinogen oxidase/2-polyprenyl-3-methyl-5-hydroxy-6-metoxy-1,4-benzoquinol methylase